MLELALKTEAVEHHIKFYIYRFFLVKFGVGLF